MSSALFVAGPILLALGVTFVIVGGVSSRVALRGAPGFAGLSWEGRF